MAADKDNMTFLDQLDQRQREGESTRPTEQEEADLIAKLAMGEVGASDLVPPAEYRSQLETLLVGDVTPPPGATIH